MSSCSITEAEDHNHQIVLPADTNLSKSNDHSLEHENEDEEDDEDEEEDVDFNPFLKETPSLEASSSLSSEIEGLDTDVADSGVKTSTGLTRNPSSRPLNTMQDYAVGDSEHGEEIVMQTTVSSGGALQKGIKRTCFSRLEEGKLDLIPQSKNETFCEKENCSSSTANVVNDFVVGDFNDLAHSRKPTADINNNDAICMRTRARYSLASFTLDELETFLQETDDDDDLQNVDDEEEYRKFLAAVLHGSEYDHLNAQENENVDDEDEDNDADFELELEEALESDLDENARDETQEQEPKAVGRRSKVRQNRQLKAASHNKKKLSGQSNRPLRPLLPNAPVASFAALDGKILMPGKALQSLPSSANNGFVCGFTPHQIGQLHCLIHEHVQLLIQVFALCVADPSRQHIASEVQVLILEIQEKRDQALAWRRVPYPSFCFCPPHVYPSVPVRLPNILPAQTAYESSSTSDAQSECSSRQNAVSPSNVISPAKARREDKSSGQVGDVQMTDVSCWLPYISGAIFSVLDVSPLKLVRCYIDDVSTAVREKKQRHVEITCDARFEKEPLFPFHNFQSLSEANGQILGGTTTSASSMVLPASVSNEMPRKTLAAALVEKAMKQSIAPVPKEIAKLAQRFIPLFNPALYPHKPPPAPVANRVLFTEAEDELLAMGLMEYNTDWKAIQQRFLPCKSKHQIFVRQKNRSSSKAPENPIKAVRRMKNSPLTAEEKARIEEGLKIFKLDWMSVWKFVVPYRDPSLLPRQWRIATGTQKSYKLDADKKAKRRLYEAKRRKCKPVVLASWHASPEKEEYSTDNAAGENNSTDDCMDKEDEAYVHEAFLADWRPGTSGVSKHAQTDLGQKEVPPYHLLQEGSNVRAQVKSGGPEDSQPQTSYEFPADLRSSKSQLSLRPYRSRKSNNPCLVKLAPDLPPVNLPPSVRVMSQSAFESYLGEAATKVSGSDGAIAGPATDGMVPRFRFVANPLKAGQIRSNLVNHDTTNLRQQGSGVRGDKCAANEKDGSDLQMHPLLFQTPEDGCFPYYSTNCSTISSFNFFSGNQPHLNLSLFHNPHQASHSVNCFDKPLKSKETTSSAFGIDFHPLLQRINTDNYDFVPASSAAQISATLEPLSGKCAQLRSSFDAILAKSYVNCGPVITNKASSPNGRSNELDLEMHLSFTSEREKGAGSRDVIERNTMKSVISPPCSMTIESQAAKNSSHCCSEHMTAVSTPDGTNMKLDSVAHAVVVSCSETNTDSVNNISDQSLPEIVMEQEELSDSDEEIDENVEFECEEMADSEVEGSDTEQIVNMQTEEVPDGVKKTSIEGTDFNGQHCEQISHGNTAANTCGPSEGSSMALNKEKDNPHVVLGLDLNSWGSDSPPTRSRGTMLRHKRCSMSKNQAPRSSRCKNTTPSTKHTAMQRHAVGVLHQPDLGSLAAAPLRKPRKRPCRTDSSSGRTKKGDLNNDMTIEGSKPVGNGGIS